jgi:hypothetical protein
LPQQFPRRIERGPLAGQEFGSRADYRRALAAERGALTEYQARSIASRARGFPHYAAERRAREAATAPTRGAVEGTLPNGHDWKIVHYRVGSKQWHTLFDKDGNRAGGAAPRESDLPRVTAVVVWTETGGWHTFNFDGDLLTWDDWFDLVYEADEEYG